MTLLSKIIKQCRVTFDPMNGSKFSKNLAVLKDLASSLSYSDLQLHPALVTNKAFSSPEKAPCTFINVYESDCFTLTIFVIRQNFAMPLHDHPGITGLLKVIAGQVRIQSYTKLDSNGDGATLQKVKIGQQIEVKVEEPVLLNANCAAVILTPSERNFHEISTVGENPSAFFDILSPPYEDEHPDSVRKCSFYRRICNGQQMLLEKIPAPHSYYCDALEYHLDFSDTEKSHN